MVTASIVTYFTETEDIVNVLNSCSRSPIDKVFVIDNSSEERIKQIAKKYPKVTYIPNINNGYGAGHNIGIKRSLEIGAQFHIVINPDIYWIDPVIETLEKYMNSHPEIGLAIPSVKNPDGSIRFVCRLLPTPKDLLLRRFIPFKKWQDRNDEIYQMKFTGYDREMTIPTASGCFMFLRNSIIEKIGGFDDRYFMYMEDVDLSRRVGGESGNVYLPSVSVFHKADRGSYKNKKLLKHHIKSAIKYFNKWGWLLDSDRDRINKAVTKNK